MRVPRPREHFAASTVALMWLLAISPNSAEAYIDPGTGSTLFSSLGILLGMASAVIVLGLVQIRRFGSWLLGKFCCRRHADPPASTSDGNA